MKNILLIMLTLLGNLAFGQIITDKTSFDFGEIEKEDKKYVDFKFTNASSAAIKIVKYDTPYGVSIRFSEEVIDPDESILVRIKYTPKRKGEFSADVPIYVSSNSQPITLTVRGKAMSVDLDEKLNVPEFEKQQTDKAEETFDLDIKVLRKEDKSPVNEADIMIIWNGVLYQNMKTSTEGLSKTEFVPDKYYVVVKANDLGYFESELSIHQGVKEFVVELGPEGTLSRVTTDSADVYETEIVEAVVEVPVVTSPEIEEEEKQEEKVEENENFPESKYRPNNIVFCIDVSVSMKQKGKLNLLKASMVELTNLLRSVDKVAIVTYSSSAQLALKPTSASDKATIISTIQNLQAKGSTSGQKGLKKAYQVLNENKIDNGNNQVFISTDGAFRLEKQDKGMIGLVEKQSRKGNKLSVIGIKNEKWTVKNMKLLAARGNGNYIHITNYDGARKSLVEEVKQQSRSK